MFGGTALVVAPAPGGRAHASTIPIVGFLHRRSPSDCYDGLEGFREELAGSRFVDGSTVEIRYAWVEGDVSRHAGAIGGLLRALDSLAITDVGTQRGSIAFAVPYHEPWNSHG